MRGKNKSSTDCPEDLKDPKEVCSNPPNLGFIFKLAQAQKGFGGEPRDSKEEASSLERDHHMEEDPQVRSMVMPRVPPLKDTPEVQSGPTVAKILQGRPTVAPISQDPSAIPTLISDQERRYGQLPLYQRLQMNLTWWEKFANPQVVKLIREGI